MKLEPLRIPTFRKLSDSSQQLLGEIATEGMDLAKATRDENKQLREEVHALKSKLATMQERDKERESQIWDLRTLVRRVGTEGYAQLREVEREKEASEKDLEETREQHDNFKKSVVHLVQMSLFWQEFVAKPAK